jgi:hypothetical protein
MEDGGQLPSRINLLEMVYQFWFLLLSLRDITPHDSRTQNVVTS